ncbi:hypothetical protein [Burkholderia pyrrocinia]|uniref:hypothetical protein n=1 Tax=Burkholderia pyrrocinia TaxID=60550 RepID=UPI0011E4DA44|nr:hypothetical protein [Burkholderia pyrrocinia]
MYSIRNRLRNKSGLMEGAVHFLSVENDSILALPPGNGGGIGQCFVFFADESTRANAGKGGRGGDDYRSEISLIFNQFRETKKDCG